jgi:DNA-binding LacI/PurR family transcriptional regulator
MDIAAAAGVSRGTVSRVLNGRKWVSDESRLAVEKAIADTGYRANTLARRLRGHRSRRVAFLINEPVHRLFGDPNFAVLVQGISDALEKLDTSLVLLMAGSEVERTRAVEFVEDGAVDGVVIASWIHDPTVLTQLERTYVPIVSCGEPYAPHGAIGWAGADDRNGARTIVEHLRSLGRRRVATIAGRHPLAGGDARLDGFRDAHGAGPIDSRLVEFGDYTREGGAKAMWRLLQRTPDLDAVFAANDQMAAGAIDALHAAGRRIPHDVAVAGFDDSAAAQSVRPALTTMRQPFDLLCNTLVEQLMEQIDGAPPRHVTVATELVVRGSTVPGDTADRPDADHHEPRGDG